MPHLELSKATDEVLLLLAARRPGEINEEVLQEAAPQIHFVAAGRDRDQSQGASAWHLQTGCSQKPRATGRSIPKWTL